MTQLLERAIQAVKKLDASRQDELAAIQLEEIEDDERWERQFFNHKNS